MTAPPTTPTNSQYKVIYEKFNDVCKPGNTAHFNSTSTDTICKELKTDDSGLNTIKFHELEETIIDEIIKYQYTLEHNSEMDSYWNDQLYI